MTTDITELAQREKFEAWFVNDVVGAYVNFPAFKDGEYAEGEIYDEQLYFMLQSMWMAWKSCADELVEELEKAQPAQPCEHSMFWDASGVRRCSKCDIPEHANVHYADAAEMEIAALRQRITELEEAEKKLCAANVALDARAELAERRLAEMESRTVTVKLPDYRNTYKGTFADEVEHQVRRALDLFSADAGIKWEAE
ncbi:hypothetical protein CFY86_08365 [Raoultella ornithinolytica]|uniref:Ead/Ea22-like family protein n=1 Tax=Raoultella ornithinolytica TaxID=54291 RepID=A0A855F5J4_RAOOR|nr:ead/Ea22-like family protein [Raoultella ornithinolytica]PIK90747.1 hypothetical protein CFY86_08365 [Raoultella ornithinolytica]